MKLLPLLAALIALATEAFGLDSIDIATLQRISDETLLVNVDSEPPKGSQAPDGQGGAGGPGGNGATVVITAMAGPKPRLDTGDSNTKKKVENAIKDLNAKLTPAVTTNLDEEVHRMFNSETERLKNLLKDGVDQCLSRPLEAVASVASAVTRHKEFTKALPQVRKIAQSAQLFEEAANVLQSRITLSANEQAVLPLLNLKPDEEQSGSGGRVKTALTGDGGFVSQLPFRFPCPFPKIPECDKCTKYRTADGTCNNLRHPRWGSAPIPYKRFLRPDYDNGRSTPRTRGINGSPLPDSRAVSRAIHESKNEPAAKLTLFTMLFGQWLDHDIAHTPTSIGFEGASIEGCCNNPNRPECFQIPIKQPDPDFTANCFEFVRSLPAPNVKCTLGYREQIDQITSFVDASNVYGSTNEEQAKLRTYVHGKMKNSANNLLPKDELNEHHCPLPANMPKVKCFNGGDERANENLGLTGMHTVWMREHNRVAEKIRQLNPDYCDEEIFQETRKIIGAMNQHIAYNEFLPIVLGQKTWQAFRLNSRKSGYFTNYRNDIDPTLRNVFAGAAYRFGHSLINDNMLQVDGNFGVKEKIPLSQLFSRPERFFQAKNVVDELMRGFLHENSQTVDRFLTSEVTKRLFGEFDLATFNIQRGRDHGLPGYRQWRLFCGLSNVRTFDDMIDHTQEARDKFKALYNSPADIDIFAAGVSELPLGHSSSNPDDKGLVGPTFACIIGLQFALLKYGDRFWYEYNDSKAKLTLAQLAEIRKVTFSRVLCDNLQITTIQPKAFLQPTVSGNSRVSCRSIPNWSLNPWVARGGWTQWSKWSKCFDTIQWRSRSCPNGGCTGDGFQTRLCSCNSFLGNLGKTQCGCPKGGSDGPDLNKLTAAIGPGNAV